MFKNFLLYVGRGAWCWYLQVGLCMGSLSPVVMEIGNRGRFKNLITLGKNLINEYPKYHRSVVNYF